MALLIDTYNVIHVVGVLPPEIAGIDTAALIELIHGSRYARKETTLVCDGERPENAPVGQFGSIGIAYAGKGVTADEVIIDAVAQSSTPRRLTVVSSDRAVLREARRRRCSTLTSEQFLRRLATDHEDRARKGRRRGAVTGAHALREGKRATSSAGPPLPRDLIREAESIAREPIELLDEPEQHIGDEPASETAAHADDGPTRRPDGEATERTVEAPSTSELMHAFLPPDVIELAEAEVAEHEREQARLEDERRASAAAEAARRAADEEASGSASDPSRADVYGSVLPDSLIDDAESIARSEPGEADAKKIERDRPGPVKPGPDAPTPPPPQIPDDIIAEAEALWAGQASEDREARSDPPDHKQQDS